LREAACEYPFSLAAPTGFSVPFARRKRRVTRVAQEFGERVHRPLCAGRRVLGNQIIMYVEKRLPSQQHPAAWSADRSKSAAHDERVSECSPPTDQLIQMRRLDLGIVQRVECIKALIVTE